MIAETIHFHRVKYRATNDLSSSATCPCGGGTCNCVVVIEGDRVDVSGVSRLEKRFHKYTFPVYAKPFYLCAWPHPVDWTAEQQVDLKPWKARAPPGSAVPAYYSRTEQREN